MKPTIVVRNIENPFQSLSGMPCDLGFRLSEHVLGGHERRKGEVNNGLQRRVEP